jgi:hypothetical protein
MSIQIVAGIPADFAKSYDGTNLADAGTDTVGVLGAPVCATPEPSSLALLGSGVLGMPFELRRRVRRA